MIKKIIFIAALVLHLTPFGVYAGDAERYSEAIENISNWVNEEIDKGRFVGVSIGFVEGDYMWTKGFGLSNIELQTPMTSESVHRLASITKSMTAVGILRLVQEGKLSLDDEVQKFVPDFPRKKWPVTVRHLLGHLSGISHYKDYELESNDTHRFTTAEALKIFQDWDLLFKPGERFSYTSYGYNLLGAVIEGATGQTYSEYMTENVWLPLSMTSTRIDDVREIIPNRVAGYTGDYGKFINCRPVSTSMKYAAGGTVSTVEDLLHYASGLMNGKILEPNWFDSMWTPMTTDSGYYTRYGMGWFVSNTNRHYAVYHSGSQDGTRTFLYLIPSRHLAIAVMCNYYNADPSAAMRVLLESLIQRPYVLPSVYAIDPPDASRLTQLSNAIKAGCAYFDRYHNQLTEDPSRISAGFNLINDALALSEDSAIENRIDWGLWPITKRSALCATSYITSKLSERLGEDYLWKYHRGGIMQICKDYVESYKKDDNIPGNFHFSKQLESFVDVALVDWLACWTPEIEELDLFTDPITNKTVQLLVSTFSNRKICPDLSRILNGRAMDELSNGNNENALRFAKIAVDMYPNSANSLVKYGLIEIGSGEVTEGQNNILQAYKRWPQFVQQGELNSAAYEYAGRGKPNTGAEILTVAIELFPKVANLYDSKAEMHLLMGDTTEAISLYNKALEIDPDFENPKTMLKKIEADSK